MATWVNKTQLQQPAAQQQQFNELLQTVCNNILQQYNNGNINYTQLTKFNNLIANTATFKYVLTLL